MTHTFTRPLAVVTGASSGIGYELAKQFAQNGFDLLVTSTGSSIEEAAQAFNGLGANVKTVQTDLTNYEGVEALYNQIQETGQPVEAIAINAGTGTGGDFARETDLQDELKLINLNVVSSVHLAKRVIKEMVNRGKGRILFTSSIAGLMPGPLQAVYAASKAFLNSFSKALRHELQDTGVTVTTLMPGVTETNFFHKADLDNTKVGAGEKDDPAEVAKQGFEALMAGKEEIIAGSLKTKVQGAVTKVLPDSVKAELHHKINEPKSDNE
jgi:short-subunit dehydrogenase